MSNTDFYKKYCEQTEKWQKEIENAACAQTKNQKYPPVNMNDYLNIVGHSSPGTQNLVTAIMIQSQMQKQ